MAAAAAKSLQLCPTLCNPIDGSPPGSPIPGILQARTLEWVAISFSNAWKWKVKVKSLSRVLTLSDPMDCSPPGSSVHGNSQNNQAVSDHLWIQQSHRNETSKNLRKRERPISLSLRSFEISLYVSDGKASACNAGDLGSNPGSGRSPGEGIGYPVLGIPWWLRW